jgi:hypothetical protein
MGPQVKIAAILLMLSAACKSEGQLTADYYVAPNGNDVNPGTLEQPFASWQKAFDMVTPGKTVFIRGGVYYPEAANEFGVSEQGKSGSSGNTINVMAYPGEKPVLDCHGLAGGSVRRVGISLESCNYWHIKGLYITGVLQNNAAVVATGAKLVSCNNNVLEELKVFKNEGTGLSIVESSEGNQVLNCDFYDNDDSYAPAMSGTADGLFLGHITERNGNERTNTIMGCRAWNNSDDGFDLDGNEGIVTIDNCWSFNNGKRSCDGGGFILGPTNGTAEAGLQRTITNCRSFYNKPVGFDQNGTNVPMRFEGNIAFKNDPRGYYFCFFNSTLTFTKNISYQNPNPDCFQSNAAQDWTSVNDNSFKSLDSTGVSGARKGDGSLPDIQFLKPNDVAETVYSPPFTSLGNVIVNKKLVAPASYTDILIDVRNKNAEITNNYVEANHTANKAVINVLSNITSSAKINYNVISYKNQDGYAINIGTEATTANNNTLDGAEVIGNKISNLGVMTRGITHCIFIGFNKGETVKYNYLENAPYGIVLKSQNMDNSGAIVSYNVVKGGYQAMLLKGIQNTKVYNNTFYNDVVTTMDVVFIDMFLNPDGGNGSPGTIIRNNIFYSVHEPVMIRVQDDASLANFQCDYNVYYYAGGTPMFKIKSTLYTFAQWQGLGYDTHSVVMDPGFISGTLIPSAAINHAVNLGDSYKTGIDPSNTWNRNNTVTKDQGSTWQNGAFVK